MLNSINKEKKNTRVTESYWCNNCINSVFRIHVNYRLTHVCMILMKNPIIWYHFTWFRVVLIVVAACFFVLIETYTSLNYFFFSWEKRHSNNSGNDNNICSYLMAMGHHQTAITWKRLNRIREWKTQQSNTHRIVSMFSQPNRQNIKSQH